MKLCFVISSYVEVEGTVTLNMFQDEENDSEVSDSYAASFTYAPITTHHPLKINRSDKETKHLSFAFAWLDLNSHSS